MVPFRKEEGGDKCRKNPVIVDKDSGVGFNPEDLVFNRNGSVGSKVSRISDP